eukprot:m.264510 g.264510  ORF g.264510 m.264510 type:complete len:284 (-) comp28250_c0_seq1:42-893(-)
MPPKASAKRRHAEAVAEDGVIEAARQAEIVATDPLDGGARKHRLHDNGVVVKRPHPENERVALLFKALLATPAGASPDHHFISQCPSWLANLLGSSIEAALMTGAASEAGLPIPKHVAGALSPVGAELMAQPLPLQTMRNPRVSDIVRRTLRRKAHAYIPLHVFAEEEELDETDLVDIYDTVAESVPHARRMLPAKARIEDKPFTGPIEQWDAWYRSYEYELRAVNPVLAHAATLHGQWVRSLARDPTCPAGHWRGADRLVRQQAARAPSIRAAIEVLSARHG